MKLISCDNMHRLVILSTVLLVTGIVLFGTFLLFGGPVTGQDSQTALYLSFGLILASPLVLAINLILSIIPQSRQILRQCSQ